MSEADQKSTAGSETAGTTPPSVGVVICTYHMKRWDLLTKCLASMRAQTLQPTRVVVVVDGCPELEQALRTADADVEILALPENVGLSAARNAGTEYLDTEWVAFLDDDAAAEPGWLQNLLTAVVETGAAGAGGAALPDYEDPARARMIPEELLWTVGCAYRGLPTTRARVRNFFGGCAMLRRADILAVGGFDPDYGRRGGDAGGGEEADLCVRIKDLKPETFYVHEPSARMQHFVPDDRATARYQLKRCLAEGRSKGAMSGNHGNDSLSSEATFVKAAPLGVLRHLREGRPEAAALLVGGIGLAGIGLVQARGRQLLARR